MKLSILEVARAEFEEAIAFYEAEAVGLGSAFAQEFVSTVDRIAAFPAAWQPLSNNVRRCRTRRFPYGLIYFVEADEIIIVAVAHLHRAPIYWRDRLRSLERNPET